MPHMVIFRSAEGKPGYHQADSLDDAIRFVEHLRNQENVPDARIFRMQEVPIEFKTYVRVEVAGVEPAAEAPAPVSPAPAAPVAAAPAPAAAQPAGPVAAGPVAAAAPAAGPVVAAEPAPAPVGGSAKHDDVVVDPMPVGQNGAANRFGRFNRG